MFETQGGTRNRTRDLPKKGSAFITSSDHWTAMCVCGCFSTCYTEKATDACQWHRQDYSMYILLHVHTDPTSCPLSNSCGYTVYTVMEVGFMRRGV